MPEQIPPHIPGNSGAVFVEGVFLHILEDAPSKPYSQKSQKQELQFPHVSSHDHVIHHPRRQSRRGHVQRDRNQKGQNGSQIGEPIIPYVA